MPWTVSFADEFEPEFDELDDIDDAADGAGLKLSLSSAVPEPATWAMMIAGFGMIGAMVRRRRAAALAA